MAPRTYRKTKLIAEIDRAYLAGLIDGEGAITLTRKHKHDYRQLCVSISSTEIEILDYVKRVTGVGHVSRKKAADDRHATAYAWATYNRQALTLVEQVHPFLQSYKKYRAKMILHNYLSLTPRNGKYSQELLRRKRLFEIEFLKLKANSEL
jgi:hypothetical protein